MKYSTHRILKSGHIELREENDGVFHRSVIAPNEPLEKYNEIIEADPNWKFRTQENADAYTERMKPELISAEQKKAQALSEARKIALEKLIQSEVERYRVAIEKVSDDIDGGKITNPSEAVRNEISKLKAR